MDYARIGRRVGCRMYRAAALLLGCVAAACGGGGSERALPERTIAFATVRSDALVGIPLSLRTIGDTLLIADFHGDPLVHCLSLRSGVEFGRMIRKGNGPGEVNTPIDLHVVGDSMYVYARPTMRLYSAAASTAPTLRFVAQLPVTASRIFPLRSGDFLIAEMVSGEEDAACCDGRFSVVNRRGERVARFGDFPRLEPFETDLSVDLLSMFHQTRGMCELDSARFAVVTSHVLGIYERDADGGYSLRREVPTAPYAYACTPRSAGMSGRTSLDPGCARGAAGGLFCRDGMIVVPFYPGTADSDEELVFLCYDTEGVPIGRLVPDRALCAPAVLDDRGRIVALTPGEELCIAVSEPVFRCFE